MRSPRTYWLLFLLLLAACQPGTGAPNLTMQTSRSEWLRQKMTLDVATKFTRAYKQGGMAGVSTAITDCYLYAITPLATPADMRGCMALDLTAWTVDVEVSGGGKPGSAQLPFFQPATTTYRWARYAPFTTLGPVEDVVAIAREDASRAFVEMRRQRAFEGSAR